MQGEVEVRNLLLAIVHHVPNNASHHSLHDNAVTTVVIMMEQHMLNYGNTLL